MDNLDYLYNPDDAKGILGKNHFVDKKLGFQVIEHGTILPHKKMFNGQSGKEGLGFGGIVDSNGRYIENTFIHYGCGGAYTPAPESMQCSSETVIYLDVLYRLWGHDITDHLSRVWFLKSNEFNDFKNCSWVYVPHGEGFYSLENKPNFRRLLEILGLDVEKIRPITQPTRFEKIILPDESFYGEKLGSDVFRRFTNEYRETIERVRYFALKNSSPVSSKKIYYFHGKRAQIGEDRLAQYFKTKGYEIVSPEKLTLDEQLNLLINAESFASTLGSASHNSMFMRDGAEAIFIPRKSYGFTAYQDALNQVHPLNVNYVDASLSIFNVRNSGPFCYIISEPLKRFFGDKWKGYEEDDLKNFLQYVKYATSKGCEIRFITNYYKGILSEFMRQLKQQKNLIAIYKMPPHWENFQPRLAYQTHIRKNGWGMWKNEEQVSNNIDRQLDIQAIKLNYPGHKIYYSVYFNEKEGWSKEVVSPEIAGTIGVGKSIYGMKIRLDETSAREFDVLYRMHKFDGTWTPLAKNGEELLSQGIKLNAIQIKLEPKK